VTGDEENRKRFEAIYAAHRKDLLGYFLRRAEPADAADLLADTFLVAWRRLDAVPHGEGVRLWLFGVARHQLANQRRALHSGREVSAVLREALVPNSTLGPDISTSLAVRQALDRLNPADRETMMLTVSNCPAMTGHMGLEAGERR
jgi:DNA-directed RNA polymerase specialized sigma24 family protein